MSERLREGQKAFEAMALLDAFRSQEWHEFWPDEIPFEAAHLVGVIGHRQVTDAYLVGLLDTTKLGSSRSTRASPLSTEAQRNC